MVTAGLGIRNLTGIGVILSFYLPGVTLDSFFRFTTPVAGRPAYYGKIGSVSRTQTTIDNCRFGQITQCVSFRSLLLVSCPLGMAKLINRDTNQPNRTLHQATKSSIHMKQKMNFILSNALSSCFQTHRYKRRKCWGTSLVDNCFKYSGRGRATK